MSRLSLANAVSEIRQLRQQLQFTEVVRRAATEHHAQLDRLEAPICALTYADVGLLDRSFSRRSDHYLIYAAGYAVLESFINDLLRSTLRFYERSGTYADLSTPTKTALRVGTARLLSRLNWRRFAHLSELDVARNYYQAVSDAALVFSDEVIIASDANYRSDEIQGALRKCGFGGVWHQVLGDPAIMSFFASTILEDNSVPSALNMLVSRRNEVAHGVVKSIDSTDLLLEVLTFLEALFEALYAASARRFLELIDQRNKVRAIGSIIHRYRDRIGIVTLNHGETISVGDTVIVRSGGGLATYSIANINLDGSDIRTCKGSPHLEVGVDFGRKVGNRRDLYLLSDHLDLEVL